MTEDNTDKTKVGLDMNKNYRRGNFRGNMRSYGRQNSRREYTTKYGNDSHVMIEAGTGLEKGCFPETMATIEIGVQAIVDPGRIKNKYK